MRNIISSFAFIGLLSSACTAGIDGSANTGNTDGVPAFGDSGLCIYLVGNVGNQTVTTPAIPIFVPDNSVVVDPVNVHVDGTSQNILGYSANTDPVDASTPGQNIYVPETDTQVDAISATIEGTGVNKGTCVSAGVTTPAVPVHIPASALQVPGAVVSVPAIHMNILGNQKSFGGHLLTTEGRQIIIPSTDLRVDPQTVNTPEHTIVVETEVESRTIRFLEPLE